MTIRVVEHDYAVLAGPSNSVAKLALAGATSPASLETVWHFVWRRGTTRTRCLARPDVEAWVDLAGLWHQLGTGGVWQRCLVIFLCD